MNTLGKGWESDRKCGKNVFCFARHFLKYIIVFQWIKIVLNPNNPTRHNNAIQLSKGISNKQVNAYNMYIPEELPRRFQSSRQVQETIFSINAPIHRPCWWLLICCRPWVLNLHRVHNWHCYVNVETGFQFQEPSKMI